MAQLRIDKLDTYTEEGENGYILVCQLRPESLRGLLRKLEEAKEEVQGVIDMLAATID